MRPVTAPNSGTPRLRKVGLVILVVGFTLAALIYLTGSNPEDFSSDPATARAYKNQSQEIQLNYGHSGLVMNQLADDLKQPATQAILLLIISTVSACACFYLARFPKRHSD
jgi:hypothetical protein